MNAISFGQYIFTVIEIYFLLGKSVAFRKHGKCGRVMVEDAGLLQSHVRQLSEYCLYQAT